MEVHIELGDVYSVVKTPQAAPIIAEVCRARPDGFMFMDRYKKGYWDGYISLMEGMNKFPTGLLPLVERELEKRGHKILFLNLPEVTDIPQVHDDDFLDGITLRKYQLEAVNKLLFIRRGVAKMATNSGKTACISAIIKAVGEKALVVVHTKDLLHQTSEKISIRTGESVGKVGDGIWEPRKITVGMIQTLNNRVDTEDFHFFDDNKLLVVDECHHVSSDQMMDVLQELPGSYRFGFSGTPLKYDVLADMKLVAMTGEVVVDISNEYLIEKGYSAEPIVHVHIIEDLREIIWKLDYHDAYKLCIVENEERNRKIADIATSSDGVVLVLVTRIEHGNILEDLIDGAVFVNGSDASDKRKRVLDEMRSGKGGVYIATQIFDEGVDVPSVDTVIIAAGGKSHIKLLQRIGRGIRAKEGENILHVHDFIDDTNKYLLSHSDERISIYGQEGFEKQIEE